LKVMNQGNFISLFEQWREVINKRLDELFPSIDVEPSSLHRAMRYSTLNGGKRIRGILCLSFHRLFGDRYPQAALDAACAIEMLHAYTLIHDDLPALDDDDIRRGKPSCHVKFGEAVAILAGDALQALSFEVLSKLEIPDSQKIKAISLLARTAGSLFLVGGQVADIENENVDPDEFIVNFIHSRKTAELIASSMSMGAIVAGASNSDISAIQTLGRKAGMAFQIVDDILDEVGDEKNVGKKLRKDASQGKVTYPSIFGIEKSRERARELIESAIDEVRKFGKADFIVFLFQMILNRVE